MKTGKRCRSKEAVVQKLSAIDRIVHYLIANAFGGDATPPSLLSGAAVKKYS